MTLSALFTAPDGRKAFVKVIVVQSELSVEELERLLAGGLKAAK